MKTRCPRFLAALLSLLSTPLAGASERLLDEHGREVQHGDIQELTLEELLDLKVTVSTRDELSSRRAPSILTVVTREDIRRNHCRDLIDVFHMVPGLNVAKDLEEGALVARGMFGFEGRTLLMVDGMQLSGLYFGSYSLGNDFPIHLIERIEVIRGPGSVLYGGVAELAVVNIITSSGSEVDGVSLTARNSELPGANGRRDLGLRMGQKHGDVEYSALAFAGTGLRSDAASTSEGRRPAMPHREDSAGTDIKNFAFRLGWREASQLKLYFQDYGLQKVDPFQAQEGEDLEALRRAHRRPTSFAVWGGEASHRFTPAAGLELTPSLSYQYSRDFDEPQRTDLAIERFKAQLHGRWRLERLELTAGAEGFQDRARLLEASTDPSERGFRKALTDPLSDRVSLNNWALMTSASYTLDAFLLTAGVRHDSNELYGAATSPRLGLTFVRGDFHGKLLYSQAFRAPLVGNNAYNLYGLDPAKDWRTTVRPERTEILELEGGYRLGESLFASANVFVQRVRDVIEFAYHEAHDDLYSANGGMLATAGTEAEVRFVSPHYKGLANLSYARLLEGGAHTYVVPTAPHRLLGVPELKLYTSHSVQLVPGLSVQASALYLSAKEGQSASFARVALRPQLLLGAGLLWDPPVPGLSLALSVHDLTNQRLQLVTPYIDSGRDALAYKGREVTLGVTYGF